MPQYHHDGVSMTGRRFVAACDPPRDAVTWPIPRNNNQFVAKCLARWKIDLPAPRPEKRNISVESAWLGNGLTGRRARRYLASILSIKCSYNLEEHANASHRGV